MTLDRDDVIETLNELITLNKDSAKGFVRAESDVEDEGLARLFNRLSQERSEMVDDLQRTVRQMGEEAEKDASTAGALERGWLNIKSAMTIERDQTDALVLEDRLAHEGDVLATYEEALAATYPPAVGDLLRQQSAQVRQVREQLAGRQEEIET